MMTACKKNRTLTNGGTLKFSTDTLKFDTVFTAAGSFTMSMKIYNPQNEAVVLSSVRLQKGNSSYFHLNIDGFQGNAHSDLKIAAHDSAYVFATVNIDPTDSNAPFIITDNLIATLNGKDFTVPFTAYGQNAHYIVDSTLGVPGQTITWLTDKPYVIIHNAAVDSGATLILPAGCRVYVNQDSRLFVVGTLLVNGNQNDSVVFQGDRLDRSYYGYEGYPGEWGGIYFAQNSVGRFSHAVLKNCGGSTTLGGSVVSPAAIQLNQGCYIALDHTVIENSIGYGILNFQGYLQATNCLVHTCGAQALASLQGGWDSLVNCTFAIYPTNKVSHTDNGTVALLNYYTPDGVTYYTSDLNATLINCIIYGTLENELVCDKVDGAAANITLNNCLVKADSLKSFVHLNNCILNQDPVFKSTSLPDFHLSANSPAIGAGTNVSGLTDDLEYKPRSSPFDIGCYIH